MQKITGFHVHVYFDKATFEQAKNLCQTASENFALSIGRMHEKPVGPHPCWSCQLAFKPDVFGSLIPWLALHRHGLTILIHPNTGNDLQDHTEHAIWMGRIEKLDLSVF